MKISFRKYSLHLIGWALLLLLPYFFSFKKAVRFDQLWTNPQDLKNLFSWVLLIGFSYANHLWLVPSFYLERKHLFYFTLTGLAFASILWLPDVLDLFNSAPAVTTPAPINGFPPPKPPVVMEISHILLLFVVSVLGSITYQTQLRLRDTEQQRLETELAHLKAQIQPHFLFNTLNSIYALAIRKDDMTADTVVKLAEFLRYVIRDAQHHLVGLEKELAYIQNYIDLQRSRLRDSVVIHFKIDGKPDGQQISPLILFSFIENAFKHGGSPDEESLIDIRLTIRDQQVRLLVLNKKVTVKLPESDSGIGIQNARQQLKLLYPDRHSLEIREGERDFRVDMNLSL